MSGDLFETFKIMNGLVNFGQNMFRKISAYQTSNLLVTSRHSLRSAHEFFRNRVINYCNQPPLRVRSSANINTLINAGLDRLKSSKPYSSVFKWFMETIGTNLL